MSLIIRNAADTVYLAADGGLVTAEPMIEKRRMHIDLSGLITLIGVLAVSLSAGALAAFSGEISACLFPHRVVSSPMEDVVAVLKSIDASGKHLSHNMDIDNFYTARNFYDRFLANSGAASETNENASILPAIPATGGNDANR